MKIEDRVGLVRGVVEVDDRYGETAIAYTFWHRHDEPDRDTKVSNEVESLIRAYKTMSWCSMVVRSEWRDYRK